MQIGILVARIVCVDYYRAWPANVGIGQLKSRLINYEQEPLGAHLDSSCCRVVGAGTIMWRLLTRQFSLQGGSQNAEAHEMWNGFVTTMQQWRVNQNR